MVPPKALGHMIQHGQEQTRLSGVGVVCLVTANETWTQHLISRQKCSSGLEAAATVWWEVIKASGT